MIDGIIFDLDGTLWDACRVVSESWGITLRSLYGAESGPDPQQVKGIMGMTAEEIARTLFSAFGDRAGEVCRQCIHGENEYIAKHRGDLYPGVREMIADLSAHLPLFIVSNCLEGYIECFLEGNGLSPCFRDHLCEGDTGLLKAGNIALIAERNGLKAPVYVGDTAGDEESAREAGIPFIYAAYGFGSAVSPDAVILSPAELPGVIDAWKGEMPHV
jgi:haloacid dehalogenase superfamily, subfamily IA, variant 1 with third motif having Dx(3-4)D or Dx(3-4)E